MARKVIDPSEILINKDGTVRGDTVDPNPWVRLIARMFDYSLFFMCLYGARQFFTVKPVDSWIPFQYLLWIPFEACFLWLWGKTPGKWILCIELKHGHRAKPGFKDALTRSFMVWLRGLGMGIPVINAICMFVAFQRLKMFKQTSWDRDAHFQVTHKPVSTFRICSVAIIAAAGLAIYNRLG